MTNSPYVRSLLANEALKFMHPLICETLLSEKSFREEYGFKREVILSFGDSGVVIDRSNLFNAIRDLLSNGLVREVIDKDNKGWDLKNVSEDGQQPKLVLFNEKQDLQLADFASLSPDKTIRLHSLDEALYDVNLPENAQEIWRIILTERGLEDDEIGEFHNEFRDTPTEKMRYIKSEFTSGKGTIASLVPPSRRYFERLVGKYDGSVSIRDYATGVGRRLFTQLNSWRPYDGFLLSLLLSSHSLLTAEINVDQLSDEDLVRAFEFLDKQGDRISQLGAVEVGLRILPSRGVIKPILTRLIEQIYSDDVDNKASGFRLLSTLFILVDGELSRIKMFSTEPPFYRKLAALSQAALIHRQLVNSRIDIDKFCEWAITYSSARYYLQSLADMRLEPRWSPDYAAGLQMKADFIGRLMIIIRNQADIYDDEISSLVLQKTLDSFHLPVDLLRPYFPGPLEGTEEFQNQLPPEIADAIQTQLSAEEISPSSFIALVNSALLFSVNTNHAELAAKALKLARYRLANIEDKSQLLSILNGLATVAAITRSTLLADELRILVRRYGRDTQYALSVGDAMRICLITSASRADLKSWREFAGDWLTELSFSELEGNEGDILHSHILYLCHVVPELWVSCGRADAALMAYNAS